MNSHCKFRLLVVALLLMGAAFANAANDIKGIELSRAEAALVEAETERFNAQIARDVDKLTAALADELTYTHATGRVQNKDEYLQGFITGNVRYQAIDVADRMAHVVGNMGMTTGVITLTIGNGMQLVSRYTGVYVKRGDDWRLLSWQTTDIRTSNSK